MYLQSQDCDDLCFPMLPTLGDGGQFDNFRGFVVTHSNTHTHHKLGTDTNWVGQVSLINSVLL